MPKNKEKTTINEQNIEDRIKHILLNTINDKKIDDNLNSETVELLDKLFELFPELKNENKHLIKKKSLHNIIDDKDLNEIVLEEFKFKENVYYRDYNGGIWDKEANLIGIIKKFDCETGEPICVFFDQQFELNVDVDNLLTK